jgi:hypothetical protein
VALRFHSQCPLAWVCHLDMPECRRGPCLPVVCPLVAWLVVEWDAVGRLPPEWEDRDSGRMALRKFLVPAGRMRTLIRVTEDSVQGRCLALEAGLRPLQGKAEAQRVRIPGGTADSTVASEMTRGLAPEYPVTPVCNRVWRAVTALEMSVGRAAPWRAVCRMSKVAVQGSWMSALMTPAVVRHRLLRAAVALTTRADSARNHGGLTSDGMIRARGRTGVVAMGDTMRGRNAGGGKRRGIKANRLEEQRAFCAIHAELRAME